MQHRTQVSCSLLQLSRDVGRKTEDVAEQLFVHQVPPSVVGVSGAHYLQSKQHGLQTVLVQSRLKSLVHRTARTVHFQRRGEEGLDVWEEDGPAGGLVSLLLKVIDLHGVEVLQIVCHEGHYLVDGLDGHMAAGRHH